MAALAGIKSRYAMITGLGYMFEADSLLKKGLTCLAALLYRFSLSFTDAVFFQNTDDVRTFREWHCLPDGAKVVLTKRDGRGHRQIRPCHAVGGSARFSAGGPSP
ncbi:MAG: hypothetical protein V8Q84_04205 [Bilophila sp.]